MIDLSKLKDGEVKVASTEAIDLHTTLQEHVIQQIRHLAIPPFEETMPDKGLGKLTCKQVSLLINEICQAIDAGIVVWMNKQMEKYDAR